MTQRSIEERRAADRAIKAAIPIEVKRAYNAAWRATVPEEWREAKRKYNRERLARLKAADPNYHAKVRAANPERQRELDRQRYARDRAKRIEVASIAAERRRARLLKCQAFRFSRRDWAAMKRRFDQRCAYCGARTRLVKEHVIPLARGGSHGVGNIVPACQPCNWAKGTRTPMEWRLHRMRIAA